jgi:hypothetical protein
MMLLLVDTVFRFADAVFNPIAALFADLYTTVVLPPSCFEH